MTCGHDLHKAALELDLPPVSLFVGPESVGKRSLALHLAAHHGIRSYDLRVVDKLSVEAARDLKAFASVAPFSVAGKMVVSRLDEAREEALNALLKLLEEPPPTCSFILLASRPVYPTIVSRCRVYRFGYLTDDDLCSVLTDRLKVNGDEAARVCVYGQVRLAQEMLDASGVRAPVLSALKAVSEGDVEKLENATVRWGDREFDALLSWTTEAVTGRWRVFSQDDTFGLAKDDWPLLALRQLSGLRSRPRLAVRVVLGQRARRAVQRA